VKGGIVSPRRWARMAGVAAVPPDNKALRVLRDSLISTRMYET
jgi:hypothetical protein